MAGMFSAFFSGNGAAAGGGGDESKTIKYTEKDNEYIHQVEEGLGITLTDEQKQRILEKKRKSDEARREETNKDASTIEWKELQEGGKRKKKARKSQRKSQRKNKNKKIRVNKKKLT